MLPYALLVQIYFGIVSVSLAFGHICAVLATMKKMRDAWSSPPRPALMTEMSLLSGPEGARSGVDNAQALDDSDPYGVYCEPGSQHHEGGEAHCCGVSDSAFDGDCAVDACPEHPESSKV